MYIVFQVEVDLTAPPQFTEPLKNISAEEGQKATFTGM